MAFTTEAPQILQNFIVLFRFRGGFKAVIEGCGSCSFITIGVSPEALGF